MKLKNCPWCGETELDKETDSNGYITGIRCPECGAYKPADVFEEYSPEASNKCAVSAWNRRYVDVDEMAEVIELLTSED